MNLRDLLVEQNSRGALIKLQLPNDPTNMNWLIDPAYLKSVGYEDSDKFFGEFTVTVNGQTYNSIDFTPQLKASETHSEVQFDIAGLTFTFDYQLTNAGLTWKINVKNSSNAPLVLDNLGVWASLAYVMFRDKNVKRNANQSAAVFPSISKSFTKLAAVRRDHTAPNLGVYQTDGTVLSVGTYNEYSNRFFENVSPSLDGMLFHQIILAGGYPEHNGPKNDWIYSQETITLKPDESRDWKFNLAAFKDQKDFYQVGKQFGHPHISYLPLVSANAQEIVIDQDSLKHLVSVTDRCAVDGELIDQDLTKLLDDNQLTYDVQYLGEHQIIFEFDDHKTDQVIFNKMSSIKELLRNRADYISANSYAGASGKYPYSFGPVSNQGESLGKMNFVLQECLLDPKVDDITLKIQQVEESAVKYVRPKWFVEGDFKKPAKLYGTFYRVMDLEYIAHLFFLLSQCQPEQLKLNSPKEYLQWAATVFNVRVNPELHDDERGKAESQMLGQYFLYIHDLLKALKKNGLDNEYEQISKYWEVVTNRIADDSANLSAAMTEHFFDNAGFGPAAGALALSGHDKAAKIYGELLKANIGFSNDFRAQSPDRWWEALSYMMHSLWGGVTAASALMTGRELGDADLVNAGYRATVALLYMYDSNATATDRILSPGEAASTYSIAGPNLNRPDLSRNRFGQSIFASDGGIFKKLFPDGYTGEDDWDMGEELVAYLNGFGQETYVYSDKDHRPHVINGIITSQSESEISIQSTAPYPSRYINLDTQQVFESHATEVKFDRKLNAFH
ncbi:hypothetical protein [Secundilactobacillus yichangensis]|uniref:hypothetical protein n=1 Tax=Secundilactobacillus yichangensis TaxID=2799580 RepID=UPI001940FFB1|nr:hypothetical protein [Secundilactobacillus yichangensis]